MKTVRNSFPVGNRIENDEIARKEEASYDDSREDPGMDVFIKINSSLRSTYSSNFRSVSQFTLETKNEIAF